jgi:hypothetical protein
MVTVGNNVILNMKKKLKSIFKKGDLVYFYDITVNRNVWGYIIDTYSGYGNYSQDLIIRWNDVFIVTQNCTSNAVLEKIRSGQWKYRANL